VTDKAELIFEFPGRDPATEFAREIMDGELGRHLFPLAGNKFFSGLEEIVPGFIKHPENTVTVSSSFFPKPNAGAYQVFLFFGGALADYESLFARVGQYGGYISYLAAPDKKLTLALDQAVRKAGIAPAHALGLFAKDKGDVDAATAAGTIASTADTYKFKVGKFTRAMVLGGVAIAVIVLIAALLMIPSSSTNKVKRTAAGPRPDQAATASAEDKRKTQERLEKRLAALRRSRQDQARQVKKGQDQRIRSQVWMKLRTNWRPPPPRGPLNREAHLGLVVDKSGRVLAYRLTKKSGDWLYDRAVLNCVRRTYPQAKPADKKAKINFVVRFKTR
jgi:TonB family protein